MGSAAFIRDRGVSLMDLAYAIKDGTARAKRNWKLVLLIFGANLLLAAILALPLSGLITSALDGHGFSNDLAQKFDPEIWFDVFEKIGPSIQGYFFPQLFSIIAIYLIWKVALSIGLINRLRSEGGGFWEGVGQHFLKALGLAALYFALTIIAVIFAVLAISIFGGTGEVRSFWVSFVIIPTVVISLISIFDMMQDYARIHLVDRNAGVFGSFVKGLAWPFKNGTASWLYVFWFCISLVLWLLPFIMDMKTASATTLSIVVLLLVQQIVLFFKSGVSLAWLGSEVALYERREPEQSSDLSLQPSEEGELSSSISDQLSEEDEIEYIDSPMPEDIRKGGDSSEDMA